MRTAEECRAKSKELSDQAEGDSNPERRKRLVWMSRSWDDLAKQAEWQDGFTFDT